MSYEQYWNADPYLVVYYRKAHRIKMEEINQQMWAQGAYNYRAFEAVIGMFAYGLGGKRGRRPEGYIKEPIDIFGDDNKDKPPTVQQEEAERNAIIESLNRFKEQFDRIHKKRGDNADGNSNRSTRTGSSA